jgi:hypothetical protein
VSAYVEAGDSFRIGDGFRDSAQRCRLFHSLVGPVGIVVLLEFVKCMAEMALVTDEGPIEEFVAKCLHPPHYLANDLGFRLLAG